MNWRTLARALLCGLAASGCPHDPSPDADAQVDAPAFDVTFGDAPLDSRCGRDSDRDSIPDVTEGTDDFDGDGIPNYLDWDSDNDGRGDRLEANLGRAYDCMRPPADSDRDGAPDFLDLDSDANGIPDERDFIGRGSAPALGWAVEASDWNHDGTPDYADRDDDGDGIFDTDEIAPGTSDQPTDTNADGVPDYHDLDSDSDWIADRDDGNRDDDHDGVPDFRDRDSDNDTIGDDVEAGDHDLATPPVECPRELDRTTLASQRNDGLQDFRDIDSDNDGLPDRDEITEATDRCNPDSDGDGQLDSLEVAWCHQHGRTRCALDPAITIPPTDYYVVLPFGGPLVTRELEFGTSVRSADVFFLFDTTGSMSVVQQRIAHTIATPATGMIDAIRAVMPDAYFGAGHFDDFPVNGYGSGTDEPLHPLCDGVPGSRVTSACNPISYGGITMQPPSHAADVEQGALAIPGGSGGDNPEAQVEALYQIATGEGLVDPLIPDACARREGRYPCWIPPPMCAQGSWGYPCFREGALAIVVLFTDSPWHQGARDVAPPTTDFFAPYDTITPAPHTFDEMARAYQQRGARQIFVNASQSARCEGSLFLNHGAPTDSSVGPCFDMRASAEATGSVDLDGNPLVYDLPLGAGAATDFVSVVRGAIQTLVTRVPIDVSTVVRSDPAHPEWPDASRFIVQRVPSCRVAADPTSCWTEPPGTAHASAVTRIDLNTFYRVVPGTRVRFTIAFQNVAFAGSNDTLTLIHAFIDVLGDGANRLDTRDVYLLIPVHETIAG